MDLIANCPVPLVSITQICPHKAQLRKYRDRLHACWLARCGSSGLSVDSQRRIGNHRFLLALQAVERRPNSARR